MRESTYMALSVESVMVVGWWCGAAGGAGRLGRHLVLAGSSAGALAGDHCSLQEQLAAPHTPGLPPLECAGQTLGTDRAVLAEGLGHLDVLRGLREEQLGVLASTRQPLVGDLVRRDGVRVEDADTHLCHLLVTCFWFCDLRDGETKRPRIPGFGFRGLEAAG